MKFAKQFSLAIIKTVVKKIEKISNELPVDIKLTIRQYRFVSVNVLNVRMKPSQQSQLIGKLYLGDIVTIVRKKKNWTLVEFIDVENEISITGWVFTRYIKKFK